MQYRCPRNPLHDESESMDNAAVLEKSRTLRLERKFDLAFDHIRNASTDAQPELYPLIWQHNPIFWKDISAGVCTLTRRRGEDARFMRELWASSDFIYRFHRHAPKLPASDIDLQRILNHEMSSLVSETRAIHWIVRDHLGTPWGLLSLNEISIAHRRGEVLLGIKPGGPSGIAAAAVLILFQFYFQLMQFNKLVSLIHLDNARALKFAMHLGFVKEGFLRRHVHDPRTGQFVDMVQLGLLKEDAFHSGNQRLMQRLLRN